MTNPRPSAQIFDAILDAIARQRATSEPLKRVAALIFAARKLGQRERKEALDLLFEFARRQLVIERQVGEEFRKKGGVMPARRERDARALEILIEGVGPLPILASQNLPLPQAGEGYPGWMREELLLAYGEEIGRARPVLAVDLRMVSRDEVLGELRKIGVVAEASPLVETGIRIQQDYVQLDRLPKEIRDSVWVMDDGSQLVAAAVQAKPGERVLDMCAGGGGKTRYLLQTDAKIVAADISAKRLNETKRRIPLPLAGEGRVRVEFINADARNLPLKPASFDWILLDAPCSGTGTLRRAPDLLQRLTPARVDELVQLQRELMVAAEKLLKPGGKLVYATCSVLRNENEGIVEFALSACPTLTLDPSPDQRERGVRHLSPLNDGCDGFFKTTLQKASA